MRNVIIKVPRSGLIRLNNLLPLLCGLLYLLLLMHNARDTTSVCITIRCRSYMFRNMNSCHYVCRKYKCSNSFIRDVAILLHMFNVFCFITFNLFLIILLKAGDIHPNPGPDISISGDSFLSSDQSSNIIQSFDFCRYFSFVHYNVQSIFHKLNLLSTELNDFDILAFTETWLGSDVTNEDVQLPKSFTRTIWYYNKGDYDKLRRLARNSN